MGIQLDQVWEQCDSYEGKSRGNKRVRISETNNNGSSIFSPTSDRAITLPSATETLPIRSWRNDTEPAFTRYTPQRSANSATTLRRRNAIRRRRLQHNTGSSTGADTTDVNVGRRPRADDSPDVDPWQSADDLLSHVPPMPSYLSETGPDDWYSSAFSRFLAVARYPQTYPNPDRTILPVIPPNRHANFRAAPADFLDDSAADVLAHLGVESESANQLRNSMQTSYIRVERPDSNGAQYHMPSPLGLRTFSADTDGAASPEKLTLPHIDDLVDNREQALFPRNETHLSTKADALSVARFGKRMASGVYRKRDMKRSREDDGCETGSASPRTAKRAKR